MSSAVIERVVALSRIQGVDAARHRASSIASFFELMLEWNRHINVTGATSVADLLEDHLPDSIALSRVVAPQATLVDVGSGGGLPAIPFALLRPDVTLTLVEPRAKRAAFLRRAVRDWTSPPKVVEARMEALTLEPQDYAASRATFPPAEWLARSAALLRPTGATILFLTADTPAFPLPTAANTLPYTAGKKARRLLTVPRATAV